jgi:hypothetical protein
MHWNQQVASSDVLKATLKAELIAHEVHEASDDT